MEQIRDRRYVVKRYLIILVAVLILCTAAYSQTSSVLTSTTVWDLKSSIGPMTLGGGAVYVTGQGVQLTSSSTSGTVSFLATDAPFSVNNVIASWNLDYDSSTTGAKFELRGVNGGTTTAWYEVGRIGTTPLKKTRVTSDSYGYVDIDTLMLYSVWPRIEYKVTLYRTSSGGIPNLRLMALCYADTGTSVAYTALPAPGTTTSLAVPWRSQYAVPRIGGSICGPTSLSMAEEYFGVNLPTATVAADCYDSYNSIYGNWPFISQAAAKRGLKAWVFRGNNQQPIRDLIAGGNPVILSLAFDVGDLTGAPISSTPGHLVLCVGINANGDYIVNDPAGSTNQWDHIVYDQNQIAHCWLYHMDGAAIAVTPQ